MIYFTSDTHFGHAKIIEVCERPFGSVEEMDEGLIETWNSTVGRKDTVYHLGDFSFHRAEQTRAIARRLNGHIHLVPGNHDARPRMFDGIFASWNKQLREVKLHDGTRVVLCHFALQTWHRQHHGALMLHGHSHGSLHQPEGLRRMDVGVDAVGYRPISEEEVLGRLAGVTPVPTDYHERREG